VGTLRVDDPEKVAVVLTWLVGDVIDGLNHSPKGFDPRGEFGIGPWDQA